MLKSKIHRALLTETNIDYEGSITIDKKLMEKADILPYEQVHVLDVNNGARLITYAIPGEKGEICLNGAAARLATKGDIVIILTYSQVLDDQARELLPQIVHVDAQNKIIGIKEKAGTASLT